MSGAEIYLIATLISAGATYAQGQEKKKLRKEQARNTLIKGRVEAVTSKEEGNRVLSQVNKQISATVAKAGAGNADPNKSGESSDIVNNYTLRAGMNDYSITRSNADLAIKMSQSEAQSLIRAGNMEARNATFTAIAQVGMGVYGYNALGGADAPSIFDGSAKTAELSTSDQFLLNSPSFMPSGNNNQNNQTKKQFYNDSRNAPYRYEYSPSGTG